jgi:hypothetical protein
MLGKREQYLERERESGMESRVRHHKLMTMYHQQVWIAAKERKTLHKLGLGG